MHRMASPIQPDMSASTSTPDEKSTVHQHENPIDKVEHREAGFLDSEEEPIQHIHAETIVLLIV